MAETLVTSKKSLKSLPNLFDKTKTETRERKRNILYLIQSYLLENKLITSAEALQNEAQLSDQYQTCENVDLDIILQEYQSYYFTKFQKYPKIVKKLNETETQTGKTKKKSGGKQRTLEETEKYTSPSETDDFQFEIISLSNDKPKIPQAVTNEKIPFKFEYHTPDSKEIIDQIVKEFIPQTLGVSWKDCIGLDNVIEKLKEATIYPFIYPDLFKNLVTWKGVLLYGPPGTGKTLVAKALASESSTTFINITSSTFISKWRGESEKMLQVLFDIARQVAPTTLFIDELDALVSPPAQSQHEASRRFRSELLTQIDGITSTESDIFLLGSTNVPWNLDPALLRRFEKRIFVDLSNKEDRKHLISHYINQPHCIEKVEFERLAEKMESFSGSDIKTLCKEAMMSVVREKIKLMNNGGTKVNVFRKINFKDVDKALETFKPCTTIHDCKKYYEWKDKYGSW
ncbi:hypothetical protein NQ317_011411 [Molorchus minor]|uniref:AAA+ ATPase domain-containing protein n=1 Tax=Molorchus minor TaxID=1323400 RepID=A0ABQ9JS15_9CUCU|nr:hypothetical protein NQ317_011411 [Molorchus minor]